MQRRQFTALIGGAALASLALPHLARAQARPKVVVIGGGAGGAACARYLAIESNDTLDVTLVEPNEAYHFSSNLPLLGLAYAAPAPNPYAPLAAIPGLALVRERAVAIERDRKRVRLASNVLLPYDRLVLAPGLDLDFAALPGWSREASELLPHAWKGERQMPLLMRQLEAVPDGGVVAVLVPHGPVSAPLAPYERASLMAAKLRQMGHKRSKVMIFDEKPAMPLRDLFMAGWLKHYRGMVEWHPPALHGGVKGVDAPANKVLTGNGDVAASLINVIPRQMAGEIARSSKLVDASGFCPVDPFTMKTREDPAIYVLGDAALAGDMSRTAYAARSQAVVVAMQLRGELTGARTFPARFEDRAWAFLSAQDALHDGGEFESTEDGIHLTASLSARLTDTPEQRKAHAEAGLAAQARLAQDIFG